MATGRTFFLFTQEGINGDILDDIRYDICKNYNVSFENNITSYPVDIGGEVTDHITSSPIRIQMSLLIADSTTSLDNYNQRTKTKYADYINEEYNKLRKSLKDKGFITVQTQQEEFKNMAIENLGEQVESDQGGFHFDLSLKQLKFAVPSNAKMPNVKSKSKAKAKAKTRTNQATPQELAEQKRQLELAAKTSQTINKGPAVYTF